MNKLLVIGSHLGLLDELEEVKDLRDRDVYACNRAAHIYGGYIDALVTLHPEHLYIGDGWVLKRASMLYANHDYQILASWMLSDFLPFGRQATIMRSPRVSGTTVLFAVICGIYEGYKDIVIAGAPMDDPAYQSYQAGWVEVQDILSRANVRSLSGWTRRFLESIENNL